MKQTWGPPLRAAALTFFIAGCVLVLLNPPSFSGLGGLFSLLVGAIAIVLISAWLTVLAIGKEMPEEDFRRLEDRSEALATMAPPDAPRSEFDELVAIDELPDEFLELLARTPVVISHLGREHHAYGHYMGGTVARDLFADRIVIYQDTLERDFGHDPDLLRAQVTRTLLHELAHHLGWDERGVRNLGL
jgi:predicted Zn-dependent protease with MMP-like domain